MSRGGFWGLPRDWKGLKIGHDIMDGRILPKLLKIVSLHPKIAHLYLLAPLYHGSWKQFPSFCSFSSRAVTFRGE